MTVRPDEPAPYAPTSAVLDIIDRFRNKGLTTPIDAEVLARVGVSESLIPRTLKSLQQLDLVAEDGRPTPQLEGLRKASTEEFKPRLAEVVKAVYADVFQFADPATDDETRVTDAFRVYRPVSMRPRMISLFMGLCEAAGIIPEGGRKQNAAKSPRAPAKPRMEKRRASFAASANVRKMDGGGLIPPPLMGLLASLPDEATGWTQSHRDSFLKTFTAVLDYVVPIRENAGPDGEGGQ